ncbi:dihydroneopterin aldolase [Pollutibacter soli]|uniref:dihydroneopterin aldolase n=1 Tax=Pollutibacter soli TaxID=3034157 RepID=UPI0030141CCF
MITVFLHDLRFHAYQGLFDEEHRTGNELVVNIELRYQEKERVSRLDQTINYGEVFQIIKTRLKTPGKLLESLAMDIAEDLKTTFPQILEINISISKLQAPILNFQGQPGIRYQKKFDL